MNLTVNGQKRAFTDALSVADLLGELKLDPQRVAVEHNRAIVVNEQFGAIQLVEGDTLEIVQFVGGG